MDKPTSSHQTTLQIKLDWRLVSAFLLVVLAVMLWFWQPWNNTSAAAKTISVRGSATVSQVPDAFQFTPVFQADDAKTVTKTGNDAVAALKKLGVKDKEIKTSVSSYSNRPEPLAADSPADSAKSLIYPYPGAKSTYSITITVTSKELAQKVADYLATTTATGVVTPQSHLSTELRSKLDLQARSKASDDARSKAAVMAKQLGAKLGKVVSVEEDGTGIMPYARDLTVSTDAASPKSSGPTVEPGVEEVTYTATVVFELK